MGPIEKVRLFCSLPSRDRSLLWRSAWMLLQVDVQLRIQGWSQTRDRWLRWADLNRSANGAAETRADPRQIAWLVERAARTIPWPATCLRRSLVLWALLRREGVDSELRMGARKDSGMFQAHAWIEWNGRVLNDRKDVAKLYPATFDEPRTASVFR